MPGEEGKIHRTLDSLLEIEFLVESPKKVREKTLKDLVRRRKSNKLKLQPIITVYESSFIFLVSSVCECVAEATILNRWINNGRRDVLELVKMIKAKNKPVCDSSNFYSFFLLSVHKRRKGG